MALGKKSGLFSSRNQRVSTVAYLHWIGQANHAWPRDVSPRAPIAKKYNLYWQWMKDDSILL